jgi:zinc D-Ala-D-Ala carboxypeptidase
MLSPHFSLSELTVSQMAARRGIKNVPDAAQVENLRRLAAVLEQVRAVVNKPITVNSGFRSVQVNGLVGGAPTSEHCDGRAADIICPAYGNPWQLAKAIEAADIAYNQLILEYGAWVHISIPRAGYGAKMQTLTYRHGQPVARGLIA